MLNFTIKKKMFYELELFYEFAGLSTSGKPPIESSGSELATGESRIFNSSDVNHLVKIIIRNGIKSKTSTGKPTAAIVCEIPKSIAKPKSIINV